MDRCCPLGAIAQRRASRSPRCQRSRSADVDRLKKYTERRIEERRHTDGGPAGSSGFIAGCMKINSSPPLVLPSSSSPPIISNIAPPRRGRTIPGGNSQSSESAKGSCHRTSSTGKVISCFEKKSPKRAEDVRREHAGHSCARTSSRQYSASSWIQSRASIPLRPQSEATGSNSGPGGPGSPRWMTFVKNPSPCPPLRRNSMEKKSRGSIIECGMMETRVDTSPKMDVHAEEANKFQPMRKCSAPIRIERKNSNVGIMGIVTDDRKSKESPIRHVKSEEVNRYTLSKVSGCKDPKIAESASADRTQRLSQRIRELYDFKTDNEWTLQQRKLRNPLRPGEAWISKSSSEEEKPVRQSSWEKENREEPRTGRRNSQDLEFNDRCNPTGGRNVSDAQNLEDTNRWRQEKQNNNQNPISARAGQGEEPTPVLKSPERRNKPKPRAIRSQEDDHTQNVWNTLFRQRRTYSDEYDDRKGKKTMGEINYSRFKNPSERVRLVSQESAETIQSENTPRPSYAEIDLNDSTALKRNSRTSDVSYASIACSGRASFEANTSTTVDELPELRALSQDDEPTFPLIPRKTRILAGSVTVSSNAAVVAATNTTTKSNVDRKKRNSTRYKVYLT